MKKITALALALALLLACAPALAEGGLAIVQENMQQYKSYVCLYAKIVNQGDAPAQIASMMEFLEEGEAYYTGEFNALGDVLQPGETAYAYVVLYLYGDADISGYSCEVEGEEPFGDIVTARYDAQAELRLDVEEGWDTGDYIFITYTNTADETVFGLYVSGILLDGEGNILYLSVPVLYNLGVTPGSTVIFKCEIPPYVSAAVDRDNLTVDAAVYTNDFTF